MIVLVDEEKAFDTVQQMFMIKKNNKIDIEEIYLSRIKLSS